MTPKLSEWHLIYYNFLLSITEGMVGGGFAGFLVVMELRLTQRITSAYQRNSIAPDRQGKLFLS